MDIALIVIRTTINFGAMLLIVAIGGMFSERSGVINIALEGIMIIGALCGSLFIYFCQGNGQNVSLHPIWLQIGAVLVAALMGALFSLLLAFSSINLKADQTIGGTALNTLGAGFALVISKAFTSIVKVNFKNTGFAISQSTFGYWPDVKLSFIESLLFDQLYISTIMILVIVAIAAFVLYKTKFGLRLRACGEHPHAADSVGINVYKYRYAGVVISGALAGIGGMAFFLPFLSTFNTEYGVAGYGFLALAVMIFGNWKPLRILLGALFFGFFTALSATYSSIGNMREWFGSASYYIYKMLPYIATMVVLAFTSRNSRAPKAEGIPYDKALR